MKKNSIIYIEDYLRYIVHKEGGNIMLDFLNTTPKKIIAGALVVLVIGLLIFLGVKFGAGKTPGTSFTEKNPTTTVAPEETSIERI